MFGISGSARYIMLCMRRTELAYFTAADHFQVFFFMFIFETSIAQSKAGELDNYVYEAWTSLYVLMLSYIIYYFILTY